MFYSNDLLSRKTPLGAVWTLAHGKKLSKGKIIDIDLAAIWYAHYGIRKMAFSLRGRQAARPGALPWGLAACS
jgi:hypothetical protein